MRWTSPYSASKSRSPDSSSWSASARINPLSVMLMAGPSHALAAGFCPCAAELMGVPQQVGDGCPAHPPVEIDADPAAGSDVGRCEIALGIRADHQLLVAGACHAPDGGAPTAMMAVRRRVHGEDLVADPKGRLAPGRDLMGLRQGKAELPQ